MIAPRLNREGSARVVSLIAMGRGTIQMSQIHKGIFGALAIALMFGAAQLAFGHDLMVDKPGAPVAAGTGVNRATKADRAPVPSSPGQTRTIALQPDGLDDTSVLVRVPVPKEARNRPAAPSGMKSRDTKTAVACEPPVSVLTEVAKLLQPGRCVT